MMSALQLEAAQLLRTYDRSQNALTQRERQLAQAQLDWLLRVSPVAACQLYLELRRERDATEIRQRQKNDQLEHSHRDGGRQAAEASGGDSAQQGGKK